MREGEISLRNLISIPNLVRVLCLVMGIGDDRGWNTFLYYGMYYLISVPFIVIGFLGLVKLGYQQVKERKIDAKSAMWIGTVCSGLVVMLVYHVNINKGNHIHFYIIILIALGIETVVNKFSNRRKHISLALVVMYSISVWSFSSSYFNRFNEINIEYSRDGVMECVDYVNRKDFATINVDGSVHYPYILYFDETPVHDFIETRVYTNFPDYFLDVQSFTKYTFGINYDSLDNYDAYIVPTKKVPEFPEKFFEHEEFGLFSVVYTK